VFLKLVNHNNDIKSLVEKGYAVAFDSNYMVLRDIPYLDVNKDLQQGAIVVKLEFKDNHHVIQHNHQIFFAGSSPYGLDGKLIPSLGDRSASIPLSEDYSDVIVQRSFSNKPLPSGKFKDFFEKIESYVAIICGPAIELHKASPYTYRCNTNVANSVFKFHDTLSSRAEITDLSARFKNDVVAIIGLGGTGAYVLDFLVKAPIQEIRAFDLDQFYIHNAFRSPGKLEEDELDKSKAHVYQSRYNNFRTGLVVKPKFIDNSCSDDFKGVTFAFVCVDKGSSRADIFDLLLSLNIPFIDVGMGLHRKNGALSGMLRTTYYSVENGKNMRDMGLAELSDSSHDEYRTNVQIGELNALNACLAVIRFKQLRGFYFEEISSYNLLFDIADMKIVEESSLNEN